MTCEPLTLTIRSEDEVLKMTMDASSSTPLTSFDVEPTERDQTILPPEGYGYSSGTVRRIPERYKDTSNADVVAEDILEGKTAYGASGEVVGAIPSKAAATITPTTANQIIAGGQYLKGDQVVEGSAHLLAKNIREGVDVFGVTGEMTPGEPKIELQEEGIDFIDYDGTIIARYASVPDELPPAPEHEGLTFQEWNWTIEQLREYFEQCPRGYILVGAVYIPTDRKTHIKIKLDDENLLSPTLSMAALSGSATAEIDWGDGTVETISMTSSIRSNKFPHTYQSVGEYEIIIAPFDKVRFSSSPFGSMLDIEPFYGAMITEMYIGDDLEWSANSASLAYYCFNLKKLIISKGHNSHASYAIRADETALRVLILPSDYTGDTGYIAQKTNIEAISLPYGAQLKDYFAYLARNLRRLVIPPSVSVIGHAIIASAASSRRLVIPPSVTSIYSSAFSQPNLTTVICYGHTPPSIQSNSLPVSPNTRYYVHSEAIDAYKTATNWSNVADQIYSLEELP